MSEDLVVIRELAKQFDQIKVLNKISFSIRRGEIFGLLGLNGAGKTTLFKCILQFVSQDSGEIHYQGFPLTPPTIHRSIGYLPEFFLPPAELSARELLRLLALGVSGRPADIDALLVKTGLNPDKRIREYSRGMIQRLGLAMALLKNPDFVVLDEPTLGLDPLVRSRLLDWLQEMNQDGKTILLSSHDFSQVEKLCHRVAILHQGVISYIGDIQGFLQKRATNSLETAFLKEVEPHA
ncbi:MAG TPA: ATP-binding cassette domain-containing protein [Candidatus Ozemobacteraceae bacterium]|nr:ATP-binding cassette domain-containing protein [Candidatus Ozemobacteraceae bacterium]